jgi:hypothetical protein
LDILGQESPVTYYPYPTVDLRIEKVGNRYLFEYRPNSSSSWIIFDTRYTDEPVQWAGLTTQAQSERQADVITDYDYFYLTRNDGSLLPEGITLTTLQLLGAGHLL